MCFLTLRDLFLMSLASVSRWINLLTLQIAPDIDIGMNLHRSHVTAINSFQFATQFSMQNQYTETKNLIQPVFTDCLPILSLRLMDLLGLYSSAALICWTQ